MTKAIRRFRRIVPKKNEPTRIFAIFFRNPSCFGWYPGEILACALGNPIHFADGRSWILTTRMEDERQRVVEGRKEFALSGTFDELLNNVVLPELTAVSGIISGYRPCSCCPAPFRVGFVDDKDNILYMMPDTEFEDEEDPDDEEP